MLTWTIRRAVADDAAALSLVASATFLEAFAGVLAGPDIVAHCTNASSADAFAKWIADPEYSVTLAEAGDGAAPLGYTLLAPPDLPVATTPQDIELKRIYVLATAHGSGLAGQLFDRAMADARAQGKTRMLLGVYADNRRAQRFYEKHGFARIGERRFRVGANRYDDVVFARAV